MDLEAHGPEVYGSQVHQAGGRRPQPTGLGAPGPALATEPTSLLTLAGVLAQAPSGIGFIYAALDWVASAHDLRDAMVVVDGPSRPQAFRLRRARLSSAGATPLPSPLHAPRGLHTDPSTVDEATGAYITSLAELALRLDSARHDASRDSLTGLPNRRSYEDALAQATARAQRYGWPFALVLLDLDHFKDINDRYGHGHGDQALRLFGTDLRSCLRSGDIAARVGGDEFALLVLAGSGRPAVESLVQRLRSVTSLSAGRLGLGFSAGVAYFPEDATDAESLSRLADQRLYADKAAGQP